MNYTFKTTEALQEYIASCPNIKNGLWVFLLLLSMLFATTWFTWYSMKRKGFIYTPDALKKEWNDTLWIQAGFIIIAAIVVALLP